MRAKVCRDLTHPLPFLGKLFRRHLCTSREQSTSVVILMKLTEELTGVEAD